MVEALYVRQLLIAMFEQVMQPGAAENTLKCYIFETPDTTAVIIQLYNRILPYWK